MAVTFRYFYARAKGPVIALGGRLVRPRPIIEVMIHGPKSWVRRNALLDTGADDTVFPESLAVSLGLDLSNAPTAGATGIGTGAGILRYAPVTLEITDGSEIYKWTTLVAFTSLPMRTPLLGFAGCLQYFTATFDGHAERVTLEANALLPAVV
jgi:hypothetical protein